MYNNNQQTVEVLMAEKKTKTVAKTDEERYLEAKKLTDATPCLMRDKEKAEIYDSIAKIYESLGNYKDSEILYKEAKEQANKFKEQIKEKNDKEKQQREKAEAEKEESKGIFRKVILSLILVLIIAAIGGAAYLKTKPGRYARADFYEKIENYEKSYKMFHNLKDYKDSADRSQESRYEFAIQSKENNQYTDAKDAFRALDDYKESKSLLTELEIDNIKNSEIGTSVLFGEYKWLMVEKKADKVLLVKSEPINGYPYHETNENITWEESTLRDYLNSDFLDETFCQQMKDKILETEIVVPDNEQYRTKGGRKTTDKLFLLNDKQAQEYKKILDNYSRDWWLINPGNSQNTAQYVSYGEVMDYGYEVSNKNIYIRPAMWVSIK